MTDPRANLMQNTRGEWVPAIPLPTYRALRRQCRCGNRYWTTLGYRGHYALTHILGLEYKDNHR